MPAQLGDLAIIWLQGFCPGQYLIGAANVAIQELDLIA
jgi:hypothetical protein